jgi:nicotinamidase-related amidase
MNRVVDLRSYLVATPFPTLVLIDLQQDYVAGARMLEPDDRKAALAQCAGALAHARGMGFPVAFARSSRRASGFGPAQTPRWIERFEPRGSEMVFERDKPSCFSNPLFADAMRHQPGALVLAGFAGETGCLSTAIDAHHRGHDVIFLADASASHGLGGLDGHALHEVLGGVIGLYATVSGTEAWMRSTSALRPA